MGIAVLGACSFLIGFLDPWGYPPQGQVGACVAGVLLIVGASKLDRDEQGELRAKGPRGDYRRGGR